MSSTPKLVRVQTSMNGRFQAHRDLDYTTSPATWKSGPSAVIGQPIDIYGAGGSGLVRFDFDGPAPGKVITLSIEDPTGQAHFYTKTVSVPKPRAGKNDLPQSGVAAAFNIPACDTERQIVVKGTAGGVEVSCPVTIFP